MKLFPFHRKQKTVHAGIPDEQLHRIIRQIQSYQPPRTGESVVDQLLSRCGLEAEISGGGVRVTGRHVLENCRMYATALLVRAMQTPSGREVKGIRLPEGVTEIGERALAADTTPYIELPGTLKVIAREAFMGAGLVELVIPASVTELGESAFAFNSHLERVVIEGPVRTLPSCLFRRCTALREVILPEGLEHIQGGTFLDCIRLTSIKLPASLKYVDAGAFADCSADIRQQILLPFPEYTD